MNDLSPERSPERATLAETQSDCAAETAAAPQAAPAIGPSASAVLGFDALRAFVAILDLGGVAPAAEHVGRTPAAVSMQLKKLEETIGAPLFAREARGMRPTAAGERLIGYARKIMALHADALNAFRRPDLTGSVCIGLIEEVGPSPLSEALAAFAATHRETTVTVLSGKSVELAKQLDAGLLDLAVLSPDCPLAPRPDDRVLREEKLIWVGAVGGSAHRCNPLPLAAASADCSWRDAAVAALARFERPWRLAYVSDSYFGQIAAAAADLAVALTPQRVALSDRRIEPLDRSVGLPSVGVVRLALRRGRDADRPAVDALAERLVAAYA